MGLKEGLDVLEEKSLPPAVIQTPRTSRKGSPSLTEFSRIGYCENCGKSLLSVMSEEVRDELSSCQIVSETTLHTITRVGTLIVATIYLQLIRNRYMFRCFTVLQCNHQHCVQPVASDVEVVGYL